MEFRIELILVPVADVDRAKEFYVARCGFTLDVDHRPSDTFRAVQMTPPGSACSLTVGVGITEAPPAPCAARTSSSWTSRRPGRSWSGAASR